MNLNKVFILGNVTRDPEVRALPSGQSVTNFGIATNRFYTDASGQKKQEAEFHNIVCFGKLADISSKYLNKGLQLAPRSMGGKSNPESQEPNNPPAGGEIPIIEENYIPPQNDTGNSTDEIDVKDIPF
ncbi:MAG: single-stranded DNA-binding protein [Candidatus Staskawiczbacteria bacterium]|nr:single-stranded DNA-binding protein [Candidatus Staskawiczbacteria bacterium]